jgi:hypothetical protein
MSKPVTEAEVLESFDYDSLCRAHELEVIAIAQGVPSFPPPLRIRQRPDVEKVLAARQAKYAMYDNPSI